MVQMYKTYVLMNSHVNTFGATPKRWCNMTCYKNTTQLHRNNVFSHCQHVQLLYNLTEMLN